MKITMLRTDKTAFKDDEDEEDIEAGGYGVEKGPEDPDSLCHVSLDRLLEDMMLQRSLGLVRCKKLVKVSGLVAIANAC
jgi:hypothetical protein